ncbi:aldehyde:ferredoxin oxidoreductase [Desulfomicrobium norvegicum]|uniref:Aldehyde:ferredoxin oxidoreductase n=1 Tax=Desulfomicrobium norvegicum (strain DSM 1741 / NCIMB 8310) TaxID=52561 RepID=A0A8G2F3E3_DESNO|nr:aldehyde ferredoxin oxidoreductase family protein [Desulfomicrobium norvegicum]SFL40919.1 aldehyde:ferredoxin oxidoreductase [Desulfomicrobium norvegicum]
MYGFYNRGLRINLSTGRHDVFDIDDSLLARTLGGKGLATHFLLEEGCGGRDPLDPDNLIIFATGPVTGSSVWGSSRYGVFTKSPQTGFYSESYSGGHAPEFMDAAGYDIIIIKGASETPIWIEISDRDVRSHSANDLWGMETYATEDAVRAKVLATSGEKCGPVVIGPAAENLIRFAVIENDYWRSAGRTGVGTVLGSKKVKALAFHGHARRPIADPELLREFGKSITARAKDDKGVQTYKRVGTSGLVDLLNEVGGFPSRYWQTGRVAHRESINSTALHTRCTVVPKACAKCLMACGRLSTVKDGPRSGLTVEGPEYETIYAFGGLCEIRNIEDVIYLNDLCDRLGMDTISAGNLAALAIEATRRGRIEGSLDYGDVEGVADLLRDIAARRGHGEVLSQGIRHAAAMWDMEDMAVHVKGLEPAGYDPRALKGMGLAYATSDRGACHLRATFYKPELSGMVDPRSSADKGAVFKKWEDRLTYFDMLILCRFYRDMYQWAELATITRAVTGLDLNEEDMIRLASEVADNTRRFNLREGLNRSNDKLPVALTSHPLPETGYSISHDEVDTMVRDYYRARKWDELEGNPDDYDEFSELDSNMNGGAQ